jgi:rRNA maturation protein Nop10
MSTTFTSCPDCGVAVGQFHLMGCDVERCPNCGGQALMCDCGEFDPKDKRRRPWDGKWPGEADCERLGFFVNGDPEFPDLNRLLTTCVWNADAQRWELKQ